MPRVSVVIPTHNRLSTLPRAVDSVVAQTFQDWDLWIVDDASSDQTSAWLKELQNNQQLKSRLHIITLEKNSGVSRARNVGIENSTGEWLAFLDSDDEWFKDKLERQLQLSQDLPHLPLIYGEEIWIRNGQQVNQKKKHFKSGGRVFGNCLPLCFIGPSTSIVKRSLFAEVGSFSEQFPVCEDYELWLRVAAKHEVGFVADPVIHKFGGHADQLSNKFFAMDYWRVKAMTPFIDSSDITKAEHELLLGTLKDKCQILLRGFEKHDNLENHAEVSKILQRVMAF